MRFQMFLMMIFILAFTTTDSIIIALAIQAAVAISIITIEHLLNRS